MAVECAGAASDPTKQTKGLIKRRRTDTPLLQLVKPSLKANYRSEKSKTANPRWSRSFVFMSCGCPEGEFAGKGRRVERGGKVSRKGCVCAYVGNLISRGGCWTAELAMGMEDSTVRRYIYWRE